MYQQKHYSIFGHLHTTTKYELPHHNQYLYEFRGRYHCLPPIGRQLLLSILVLYPAVHSWLMPDRLDVGWMSQMPLLTCSSLFGMQSTAAKFPLPSDWIHILGVVGLV